MHNAAAAIFSSQQKFGSRRRVLLRVIGSILIVVSIIVGTGSLIEHYRNRAVAASERKLTNLALLVAEQVDHAFQQIEIIQGSLTERMYLNSHDEYNRKMSGYDVHGRLVSDAKF